MDKKKKMKPNIEKRHNTQPHNTIENTSYSTTQHNTTHGNRKQESNPTQHTMGKPILPHITIDVTNPA